MHKSINDLNNYLAWCTLSTGFHEFVERIAGCHTQRRCKRTLKHTHLLCNTVIFQCGRSLRYLLVYPREDVQYIQIVGRLLQISTKRLNKPAAGIWITPGNSTYGKTNRT